MNKLWQLLDNYLLKFGVAALLIFTALYPKLPSVHITHTWVYIRLEDFFIAGVVLWWCIQLLRKKVFLPRPEGYAVILYWVAGLISLIFSLLFIAPHLVNFFPKLAVLEYGRRIEYMILFFVAFSTVKSKKDIRDYLFTLFLTVSLIVLYGFGQRFYLNLWHIFPKFFEKNPFCFPAFLTGNEEFAKGTAFCLSEANRITSTFGGHYDLAAYLVFVIPLLIAVFLVIKKRYLKVLTGCIVLSAVELLNFTSSRTSFAAYLVGITCMLVFWKKKRWIIPVLAASILVSALFSNSTLQRFAKTIQPVKVVTINRNANNLPTNLQNIINKTKENEENQSPNTPPPGTITTAMLPTATGSGNLTTVVTDAELRKLQEQDIAISTVSGSFLIQKAYALDISFTTRFQAEWPRDWAAFLKSKIFGTGYSSLTLASDNDYLRALGETGLAGSLTFFFIFVIFGIYMKENLGFIKDDMVRATVFGLAGGVIGLLCNAVLIDVFEASKVAEPLWLLLGIGAGGIALYQKKIHYKQLLIAFFTSNILIAIYLLTALGIMFLPVVNNFFVADDFTWLHWAASGSYSDIPSYFLNSSGFFYRPLAKVIMLVLYNLFSFQPQGYHLFMLLLHFLAVIAVYLLMQQFFRKKAFSIFAAFLFLILPAQAENLFWISTISINLSTVFILFAVLTFIYFREKRSTVLYGISLLFTVLALFSYEGAIILPLLILVADIYLSSKKYSRRQLTIIIPYAVFSLLYVYAHAATHAVGMGGDYSYSLVHFIPNMIGNYVGYFSLFLFGQNILPLFSSLRALFRSQAIGFLIVGVLVLVGTVYGVVRYKKIFFSSLKSDFIRFVLFMLAFIFIALLPFLGLGNMSERYGYLASAGFVMLVSASLLWMLQSYKGKKNNVLVYGAAVIFVVFLFISCFISLDAQRRDWKKASDITTYTLRHFRVYNQYNIPESSVLYFVNTPIRYGNAWIFPVGLPDGLWFIYRDDTQRVKNAASVEEAKAMSANNKNSYIFVFDKDMKVSEVR